MNNWIAAVINVFNRVEPAVITPDSPYAHMHDLDEHFHSVGKVYPSLANGILVESDAVAWTLGTLVEVVPASAIGSRFDIHYVHVSNITANDTLELVLYSGSGDDEIGRVQFTQNAVQDSIVNVPFQTPYIDADERIRAAVASQSGGTDCTISINYHIY